jgi:hypothetical protein
MFEVTSSILAWVAVVMLQALLRFSLGVRTRCINNSTPSRASEREYVWIEDRSESSFESSSSSFDSHEEELESFNPRSSSYYHDEEEESSLDGDEPEMFFELLLQTGSEMMNVRIGGCG